MPKEKSSVKTAKTSKKITKQQKKSNIFVSLRFGESYTSLIFGIIAIIIATILLLTFVNNRQSDKPDSNVVPTVVDVEDLNITITPTPQQSKAKIGDIYTVVANDSLWKISEQAYGSGYNWVDIARANNLANPENIHVGDKLSLPSVVLKDATVSTGEDEAVVSRTQKVVGSTYTIVSGDTLWSIAVRAYGDDYQWTKIAKVNNLSNPNLIHPGNILKLPRN